MPIQFTCPGCKQTLVIADESRGSLIRCPACNRTFSSFDALSRATLQETNDPRWKSVRTESPPFDSGYMEVTPPRPDSVRGTNESSRRDERDPDWDGDDPLSIKRRQKGSSPAPMIFAGLAVLLVVAVVIGALVWARLGRDADGFAGEGQHDLLSLAPADSVLLLGAMTPSGQKITPWQIDQLKQQLANNGVPASLARLLEDADRVLLAGEYSKETPTFLGAILTKKPYDQEKIKKELNGQPTRTVQGVTVYSFKFGNAAQPEQVIYIAMPDPRVLVAGLLPEADFAKAVANQGKLPLLPADQLARARQLEKNELWILLTNRGSLKKKLDEINPAEVPALVAEAFSPLQRSKTASFVARKVNKDNRFELSVDCADETDAKQLQQFVDKSWKLTLGWAELFAGRDAKAGPFFNDLKQSFKTEQRETSVTASVVVSEKSMKSLEKILPGNNP